MSIPRSRLTEAGSPFNPAGLEAASMSSRRWGVTRGFSRREVFRRAFRRTETGSPMVLRNRAAAESTWLQPTAVLRRLSLPASIGLRHPCGRPTAGTCCSGDSASATRHQRTTSTGTWRRSQAARRCARRRAVCCSERGSRRFRGCRFPMPGWARETASSFMANVGDSSNMWQVAISPENWHISGTPQRATFGTTDEAAASVTSDGRMVFISRTIGSDIWSLPIDAKRGKLGGPLKRVTQDAADDYDPTLSDDGTTLVFRSRRAGRFAVVLRRLGSSAETVLTRMPEDHYPAVSRDGTGSRIVSAEWQDAHLRRRRERRNA